MAEPDSHETLARTSEYEVTSVQRGAFTVISLRGRFNDALLELLQKQVFLQLRSLALDASALSGMTMSLARAVLYASQTLRSQGHSFALLNPPDALRSFMKLLGMDHKLPVLLSESQLPVKPADVPAVSDRLDRELQQIKRDLESNALWQFTDREFSWLCPFCAALQDLVKIASRVSVAQPAVEKVWRHLHDDCLSYSPQQPRYAARPDLEARIRDSNQRKLDAARGHVAELQTKVLKLEERTHRMDTLEKGVKIAASRQRKLLPIRAPEVPGCEISYTYRPAEEVSGDFYDFVELADGRVAFVIGDVSGHGIEAGILMGMTKKVLSIRLSELGDPVAAVKKTNADIVKDMDRSSFVTAAALIYDPAARTLTCARAGHNPPILYSPSRGDSFRRLETGGLMIGMAAPSIFDAQLTGETVDVQPGDLLLLYTDGLEEGKNKAGEEFGVARILPVLRAEHSKPGPYLLGALFYEFDRFAGGLPLEDDLTAVCVKFKG